MSGEIVVLSGLPAAGKSTEAAVMRSQGEGVVVIARDALRVGMFGDRATAMKDEANLTLLLRDMAMKSAALGYRVVVDDVTVDAATRQMWRDVAAKGFAVRIVELLTPVETCIERDAQRPHPVGEETIRAFAAEAGR